MSVRNTRIPAKECICEACGYKWFSISKKLPECCPNRACRSREWNGKKVRVTKPKIQLPKPTKARKYDEEF